MMKVRNVWQKPSIFRRVQLEGPTVLTEVLTSVLTNLGPVHSKRLKCYSRHQSSRQWSPSPSTLRTDQGSTWHNGGPGTSHPDHDLTHRWSLRCLSSEQWSMCLPHQRRSKEPHENDPVTHVGTRQSWPGPDVDSLNPGSVSQRSPDQNGDIYVCPHRERSWNPPVLTRLWRRLPPISVQCFDKVLGITLTIFLRTYL